MPYMLAGGYWLGQPQLGRDTAAGIVGHCAGSVCGDEGCRPRWALVLPRLSGRLQGGCQLVAALSMSTYARLALEVQSILAKKRGWFVTPSAASDLELLRHCRCLQPEVVYT